MGFLDTFKGKQYKTELEKLQQEHEALKALMTPEMQEAFNLQNKILNFQNQITEYQNTIEKISNSIAEKNTELSNLEDKIIQKKKDLINFDDEILVQEFGLYKPIYNFANALGYKEALNELRAKQKELIKNKRAVTGNMNWSVNGSSSQGKKMVSDTQKLLLRAFNTECDSIISNVKYTNFVASLERLNKSASAISKLGKMMDIAISTEYLNCRIEELHLAFEYIQKKQQEKEEQKAARAEQREQVKIQKELEEQRHKIEKEQTHYQTAYEKLMAQLSKHPDDTDLQKKKEDLEKQLSDIDIALTDIDYRQANMRAGYVYIVSNIGSFGENVYKIGMTRRLDPQERIDELGGASVPFKFDVHAMIFSDDAPALEAALHRAFEDKKVNIVNQRREFFNVTLDEIKAVVRKNFDKTVEFIDIPDAEQYRVSMKMRTMKNKSA
ncbi:MAG: DUF4041 domain-containing protein [Lachnospiraceae bacterium]|nr:DUF4041 domain-containing protein [Lachnospiraceae bacterium]